MTNFLKFFCNAVAVDVQRRYGGHLHVDEVPVQRRRGAPVGQHLPAAPSTLRCLRPCQLAIRTQSMESCLRWSALIRRPTTSNNIQLIRHFFSLSLSLSLARSLARSLYFASGHSFRIHFRIR